jgi:hypothetical protein
MDYGLESPDITSNILTEHLDHTCFNCWLARFVCFDLFLELYVSDAMRHWGFDKHVMGLSRSTYYLCHDHRFIVMVSVDDEGTQKARIRNATRMRFSSPPLGQNESVNHRTQTGPNLP